MDNYAIMTADAARRFCTYDFEALAVKNGVSRISDRLEFCFLGDLTQVDRHTGAVTFPQLGRNADFCEALTVYDWLCDSKPNARAAWEFCPVTSLPGVLVSGSGLTLNGNRLASSIDGDPDLFCQVCEAMGGEAVSMGDMGYQFIALPGLPVRVKFYHSDEEFPASMTLLWDKNILQFIRYETVYYLAGCLLDRLERRIFSRQA